MDERSGTAGSEPVSAVDSPLSRLEADLALQAAGLAALDRDAEVAERLRAERVAVALVDRLRAAAAAVDAPRLRVSLSAGGHGLAGGPGAAGTVEGVVEDVGADHVLLTDGPIRRWVALAAVGYVEGLPRQVGGPPGPVAGAWSLTGVLRRLAGDGVAVRLWCPDGTCLEGSLRLVARDHVDLELHPYDEAPGRGRGRTLTLPVAALACVEARRG